MKMPFRRIAIGTLAALTLIVAAPVETFAFGGHAWHGGGWHGRGGYWAGPAVAGLVGGLALGALAAPTYPYGPAYPGGCGWQDRPAYDAWGRFIGYHSVQICR